jgi:hypothetical protein
MQLGRRAGVPVTVPRYYDSTTALNHSTAGLYPAQLLFTEPSSLSHFESGVEIWGECALRPLSLPKRAPFSNAKLEVPALRS